MLVAGVDEVGRGPLVGSVVAAAVILPAKHNIKGIKDSKLLTPKQREKFQAQIIECAIAWHIASADHLEIDRLNILRAALLAMRRAVLGLPVQPDQVIVDGNICPEVPYPVSAVIGGDNKIEQISAASILAKVYRDQQMCLLDQKYPGYGFAKNKGYGTPEHLAALRSLGPIAEHRRSFAPVAEQCSTA